MRDKLIIFVLFFIPLLIVVGVVYYFFFSSQDSIDLGEPIPLQSEEEPDLEPFVEQKVISPVFASDHQSLWFFSSAGRLFRKDLQGEEGLGEYVISPVLSLSGAIWQVGGSDFIVERILDGHTRYQFYDSGSRSFIEYSGQIREPQFLPGRQSIVYDWVTGAGQHELKVSNLDNTEFRTVAALFRPDYQIVSSPVRREAVIFSPTMEQAGKLPLVDIESGEFRDIDSDAYYSGAIFSPDGTLVLAQKKETPQGVSTWMLYNLLTLSATELSFSADIGQIAWADSQSLVVGSEAGFQKYSVLTGQSEQLHTFEPGTNFRPTNIMVYPGLTFIFFTDEISGYLYRVDLE